MNRRTLLTSLLSGLTAGVAAIAGRSNKDGEIKKVNGVYYVWWSSHNRWFKIGS